MHYKFQPNWSLLWPSHCCCVYVCEGGGERSRRRLLVRAEGESTVVYCRLSKWPEEEEEETLLYTATFAIHYGSTRVVRWTTIDTAFTVDQNVLNKVEAEQLF
jgi:hypothetical protein